MYSGLCRIVCTLPILGTQNCPLGPCGLGLHGLPSALMGRALIGPRGPKGPGPNGPGRHGPAQVTTIGRALMAPPAP